MPKKAASKIWHKARDWDRRTRQKHRHGGIIGRSTLAVLYSLLWDFLNHETGRLDPAIAAIAAKAGVSARTAAYALQKLRSLGLIIWQRRCEASHDETGAFRLRQRSNAYGIVSPTQWHGYTDSEPPTPQRDELGFPARRQTPLEEASQLEHGNLDASTYRLLMSDQTDRLAVALAQLGRAMAAI
jgi:hypothetical protein